MQADLRTEPREAIALPLHLASGERGVTRDISATGLFFEIDCSHPLGSELDLTVELNLDGRAVRLECRGQVVRVEHAGERTGVAVKMLASRLESTA